jgi:hypothetical protein
MGLLIDVKAAPFGVEVAAGVLAFLVVAASLPVTPEFVSHTPSGYYDLWMVDGNDGFKLAASGYTIHVKVVMLEHDQRLSLLLRDVAD